MQMISFENTLCSYDDDLLSSYTSSFLNVLDIIAPVKVRMVKSRQRAPWRKEESVRAQKRECRRAERKWCKSKLQIHYEVYKEKLCVFNQTLRRTRESYFSEIIKNCSNNSHVLLATVNRLTNLPVSLPLELISTFKVNELLQYSLMTKFKVLKMK